MHLHTCLFDHDGLSIHLNIVKLEIKLTNLK